MTRRSALVAFVLTGLAACSSRDPVVITGIDGIETALAERRGNACLVNFWATWCPPCVAELRALMAVAQEFEPSGARVLGVSFDLMGKDKQPEATLEKVRSFLEKRELPLETLICAQADLGRLIERFQLPDAIPVTYAYDAQGKLVDQHVGQGSRERFRELMQKALGR